MRASRSSALALAATLALVAPGAAAAAGPAAAAAPVNVSLYWPSGAATDQAVIVPVGGTVQVLMQVGSDGGYEATVTAAADPTIFTTAGPAWFHTKLGPGAAGGYTYELWTLTAVAADSTTFATQEARSWETGPGTLHMLHLQATSDGVAPLDTPVQYGDRCAAGYTTVGVGIGDHVAIRLDSNATTGYLWSEPSVPNTNAFRPDATQGTYTAPGPNAPIGAGGFQTFGYTGLAVGSSPIDLVYARADGTVGQRCAPTIAVGAAAAPRPADDTIVAVTAPEPSATPVASGPPEVTATPLPVTSPAAGVTPPPTSADGPSAPTGPGPGLLALLAILAAAGTVALLAKARSARA